MSLPPIHFTPSGDSEIDLNEFRKALIKIIQDQASGNRVMVKFAKTKRAIDRHNHKAESYDYAVAMLEAVVFEKRKEEK